MLSVQVWQGAQIQCSTSKLAPFMLSVLPAYAVELDGGWGLPSILAGPHLSVRWCPGWRGNHACVLTHDLQPASSTCVIIVDTVQHACVSHAAFSHAVATRTVCFCRFLHGCSRHVQRTAGWHPAVVFCRRSVAPSGSRQDCLTFLSHGVVA
jgi:hypothetical protein